MFAADPADRYGRQDAASIAIMYSYDGSATKKASILPL